MPYQERWKNIPREKLWENTPDKFNIALRFGSICDLESDSLGTEMHIRKRLDNLGIRDEPICVSRRGYHHFIKIKNAPENVTAKNWNPDIGKGEARIRNCYSLIPNSEINSFQYHWNNDWYTGLKDPYAIEWSDISDMITPVTTIGINTSLALPRYILVKPEPWIYEGLETLQNAKKGLPIIINNKRYPSRNELEAAIMTRLDSCGYSFEKIINVFDKYQPGHFMEQGTHKYDYMRNVYNSIQSIGFRPNISQAYYSIEGEKYKHKALRIILSVCHQFNHDNCYLSLEQICDFMGMHKNKSGSYTKAGVNKAIKTLTKEYGLGIEKGIHSKSKGRSGKANTYFISNLIKDQPANVPN